MPSQEDYLDNLLKDIGHEEQEAQPVQDAVPQTEEKDGNYENDEKDAERQAPDLEEASDMSEDEIEQLLSGGLDASRLENDQAEEENNELFHASDMDLSDEDVLKMLAESDDDDMQEIHSQLNKSDNHESVEAIAEEPEPEEERNALLGGTDVAPAADKREERAKAKKEREEAKKRRKEELAAKRAEKKAEKKVKKASKKEAPKPEQTEQDTAENLFDTDVLDSIVSKADMTGKEEEEAAPGDDLIGEESEALPVDELAEVTPEETSGLDEIAPEENGSGGLGLDMGNLFGDTDAEDSLLNGLGGGDDSDFSDLLSMNDETGDSDTQREEKPQKKSKSNKGFFTKLLDFFTEEEEEDEEQGNENLNLSDENKGIIKDLDKEGSKKKKNKKAKKAASEKTDKEKKKPEKKPKKQPKPKKEKPPKEIPLVTDKKLSFKKVLPVVLVGVSVGVLLFVFINSAADYSDKREARAAYYAGDYQTCYLNLFGKDLDETESVMYGKSESILYIRLWIREFEMFAGEGDMVRALDSLIQTVDRYPQLYEYANQWNAGAEVAAGYATILNYLSANFGLTENQAQQIADEKKDIDYTRIVTAIANGKSFEEWNAPADAGPDEAPVEEVPESVMEDVLPEEEELGTDTFVDNQ